jgi:hypothetical protein
VELTAEFEIPTVEEDLLVYDGIQSVSEWIKHNIRCDVHAA